MSTEQANWREMCRELVDELHNYASANPHHDSDALVARACAALAAEPVVEGPTNEELRQMFVAHSTVILSDEGDDMAPLGLDAAGASSFARAVLARWGRPAPASAGEVGELVAWLRANALTVQKASGNPANGAKQRMNRAADLLEQRHPAPVPVSERLPEPNTKVLAHYFNDLGKGRTICAIWVPAKTRSDSYGDDDFTEYDEESDTFYWPEGWYEAIENWDDLGYVKVDEGEVIYWQPLPKWPATALPLPQGEVEK